MVLIFEKSSQDKHSPKCVPVCYRYFAYELLVYIYTLSHYRSAYVEEGNPHGICLFEVTVIFFKIFSGSKLFADHFHDFSFVYSRNIMLYNRFFN